MTEPLFTEPVRMVGAATFSEDLRYRYSLTRTWAPGKGAVLFVMLNPSTADALVDDPTIRRCIRFARDWGYGELLVGNLYAFRATKPENLPLGMDAVGPDNDAALLRMVDQAQLIVAAWGARPMVECGRDGHVRRLLGVRPLHVLEFTKEGRPRHPLYVHSSTQPKPWEEEDS